MALKLTKEERRAVFDGSLKILRRPERPEGDEPIIVSWAKGGKQIVDRSTGATIEVPREPRLWITLGGWRPRHGTLEWEAAVTIHDQREQHRVLANGLGGIPREPGLRTRWGERVIHVDGQVRVVPKKVPSKDELQERWTPETERGYGGRRQMEMDADGRPQPATGVSDEDFERFLRPVESGGYGIEDANIGARTLQRAKERKMGEEARLAQEYRRGKSGFLRRSQLEREERRLGAA
jgi:hypothetical protein